MERTAYIRQGGPPANANLQLMCSGVETRSRGQELCESMATARQIIALLSSHNQGDEEQFLSIALQVAANEARRGRKEVADELKRLVDSARQQKPKPAGQTKLGGSRDVAIPISRPRGELQNLLGATYPKVKLDDVVLRPEMRARLDRLVNQQRQRDRL